MGKLLSESRILPARAYIQRMKFSDWNGGSIFRIKYLIRNCLQCHQQFYIIITQSIEIQTRVYILLRYRVPTLMSKLGF